LIHLTPEGDVHLVDVIEDAQPLLVDASQLVFGPSQDIFGVSDLGLLAPVAGDGDADQGDGEQHGGGDRPANSQSSWSRPPSDEITLFRRRDKVDLGEFLFGCGRDQSHLLLGVPQLGLTMGTLAQVMGQRAAFLFIEQVIKMLEEL
jgi:hypothetical protein